MIRQRPRYFRLSCLCCLATLSAVSRRNQPAACRRAIMEDYACGRGFHNIVAALCEASDESPEPEPDADADTPPVVQRLPRRSKITALGCARFARKYSIPGGLRESWKHSGPPINRSIGWTPERQSNSAAGAIACHTRYAASTCDGTNRSAERRCWPLCPRRHPDSGHG